MLEVGDGWVNYVFRLGSDYAVRLPRREEAAALMAKEQQWLPVLTAGLPTATSVPLYCGLPQEPYPYPWSISAWYDGLDVSLQPRGRNLALAAPLARFLNAFHTPAPEDYPRKPRGGRAAGITGCGGPGTAACRDGAPRGPDSGSSGPRPWSARLELGAGLAARGPAPGQPDCRKREHSRPSSTSATSPPVTRPLTLPQPGWCSSRQGGVPSAVRWTPGTTPIHTVWLRARGWALCMASNLLAGARRHPGLYLVGSETLMEILTDDLSWL